MREPIQITQSAADSIENLRDEWRARGKPMLPQDLICGCFGGATPDDIGFAAWLSAIAERGYEKDCFGWPG